MAGTEKRRLRKTANVESQNEGVYENVDPFVKSFKRKSCDCTEESTEGCALEPN